MIRFMMLISIFVAMVFPLNAQPQESWFRTYDYNRQDLFHDVYALPDGGYVACGETGPGNQARDRQANMLVVKVDENGNEIWSVFFDVDGNYEEGRSIIDTDNGDIIVGGVSKTNDGINQFSAWRISPEGEQIWINTYGLSWCYAVIELKSGEFLLSGRDELNALLVLIDGDGNAIWRREYSIDTWNLFVSMRETDGGVIVTGSTRPRPNSDDSVIWILKIDPEREGEIIWSQTYEIRPSQIAMSIVSATNNGFIIAGYANNQLEDNDRIDYRSWWLVLRINEDGELIWSREYEMGNAQYCGKCCGIDRLRFDDNNMIIVGGGGDGGPDLGTLLNINEDGQENWRRIYEEIQEFDVHQFLSVVEGRDGSIVAAGYGWSNDESHLNGCLLKYAPIVDEPEFLRWSPLDTMQTVLIGNSLQFIVVASDQQQDTLSYLWIMSEDTLARDTTTTVQFDELGVFDVQCQVSDGNSTVAITWHVSVMEWYISGFSPEDLNLIIRRLTDVEFGLDIRSIDGINPSYLWTLTHRNQQREEIGDESAVTVTFDQSGLHRLQAVVSHEDENDEVTWVINVRSSVYSWWPSELELSAYVDSTHEFVITPFNEDSDSLSYSWFINDEVLDCDTSLIEIPFPEIGLYEITAYVQEGVEADTIRWMVNVIQIQSTDLADLADLPTTAMLYPGVPNPFNSSVRLSVYLPKAQHVSLSVFDINGREVSRLVDGDVGAGNQTFVWNASDFPAGVYLIRMKDEGGRMNLMRKVVLVR